MTKEYIEDSYIYGNKTPRVSLWTPYLTRELIDPIEIKEQIAFGYDPNNLTGVSELRTDKDNPVKLLTESASVETPDDTCLMIIGSTIPAERKVKSLRNTGVLVARYSIFYDRRSNYTRTYPEEAGYSFDLPKSVPVVRALLTCDKFIQGIAKRDEDKIRGSVEELNKGFEDPVLITSWLDEALKYKDPRRHFWGAI